MDVGGGATQEAKAEAQDDEAIHGDVIRGLDCRGAYQRLAMTMKRRAGSK